MALRDEDGEADAAFAVDPDLIARLKALDGVVERASHFSATFDAVGAARARFEARAAEVRAARATDEEGGSTKTSATEELLATLSAYRIRHGSAIAAATATAEAGEVGVALEVALAWDGARNLVDAARDRMAGEVAYKRGYRELFFFVVSTVLMLLVVTAQRGFGKERTAMYTAISSAMFGTTQAISYPSLAVSNALVDSGSFLEFAQERILDVVFEPAFCGDGVCEAPDEQGAFLAAADGGRVFSESCSADCGAQATRKARVEFFDVAKLYLAQTHMESLLEDGWRGVPAARWGVSEATNAPVAGWNVCATGRRQFGYFEDVCVLDGDVTIEGRPYRTAELDPHSSSFGGALELDLFDGAWEIRVAYDNFEWPDNQPDLGKAPSAYPAVRGRVCLQVLNASAAAYTTTDSSSSEEEGGGGDGEGTTTYWGECVTWSPCADAETCKCFFYDSEHLCFEEGEFTTWNQTYLTFAEDQGLDWLGRWSGFDLKNATTFEDLEAGAPGGSLDDDQWKVFDQATEKFRLEISDAAYPYDGWATACLYVEDAATGELLTGACERAKSSVPGTIELYLDRTRSYNVVVDRDCGLNILLLGGAGQVAWFIEDSTDTVIRSGGDCVSCDIFNLTASGGSTVCARDCPGDDGAACRRRSLADSPTTAPTVTAAPSSEQEPTAFPSSLGNVFAADLWTAAQQDAYFLDPTSACLFSSIGDKTCDTANNNAVCMYDGGDCCVDTCSTEIEDGADYTHCPLATDGIRTDDSTCASPVSVGSLFQATDEPCDLDYDVPTVAYGAPGNYSDVPPTFAFDCNPNWPFFVSDGTEPGYHVKLPFNAYAVYRDVLRVRGGFAAPAAWEMPSFYCPDCSSLDHLSGDYGTFPFVVNVTFDFISPELRPGPLFYAAGEADTKAPTRRRYFVKPNLVLVGPKLTTERYDTKACEAGEDLFEDAASIAPARCLADQKSNSPVRGRARRRFKDRRSDSGPFGVDPTFSDRSALYRATNEVGDFYDLTMELNRETGLPYGFFDGQGSMSDDVAHFPCIFDVRLNVTRYNELLTYVRDGGYLDALTKRVSLSMALFNEEIGHIANVELTAARQDEGGFAFSWSVSILDPLLYEDAGDWCRFAFEIAWLALFAYRVLHELHDLVEAVRDRRRYFTDWRNIVDWAAFVTMVSCIVHWVRVVQACGALGLLRFADVYDDFVAVGRPFYAGPGLDNMLAMDAEINAVQAAAADYEAAVAICIFITVAQSLKNLDFHPKLGLTTSTIFVAGNDLIFFGVLFLFIIFLFAVLGTLLFGVQIEAFASPQLSIMSLVDVLFGDFGALAEEKNGNRDPAAIVFFYTFVGISSLILLNALLAIIVDAYAVVKETSSNSLAPEIIGSIARRCVGHYTPPRPYYLPAEALEVILTNQVTRGEPVTGAGGGKRTTTTAAKEEKINSKEEEEALPQPPVVVIPPRPSTKVVFLAVDGVVFAVDEATMAAAFRLLTKPALRAAREDETRLVVFNICEQQGYEPAAVARRPSQEREAHRVLSEIQDIARFERLDPTTRLLLTLCFLGTAVAQGQKDDLIKPRLDHLEASLQDLHAKLDALARALPGAATSSPSSTSPARSPPSSDAKS